MLTLLFFVFLGIYLFCSWLITEQLVEAQKSYKPPGHSKLCHYWWILLLWPFGLFVKVYFVWFKPEPRMWYAYKYFYRPAVHMSEHGYAMFHDRKTGLPVQYRELFFTQPNWPKLVEYTEIALSRQYIDWFKVYLSYPSFLTYVRETIIKPAEDEDRIMLLCMLPYDLNAYSVPAELLAETIEVRYNLDKDSLVKKF